MRAANKLILFAKKAERGHASANNLLKGRVLTDQVLKKLLMETVPKLDRIPNNFVKIEKAIRHRRGDYAPMVYVTIRGSEKEDAIRLQLKQERESFGFDSKEFDRKILIEEKTYYEDLLAQKPEMEAFFRKKIAKAEFDLRTLDKKPLEKRINLLA